MAIWGLRRDFPEHTPTAGRRGPRKFRVPPPFIAGSDGRPDQTRRAPAGAARAPPRRRVPVRAEFLFDLACPFTYLAAERVERAFDHVTWTAASGTELRRGSLASEATVRPGRRRGARRRAAAAAFLARALAGRRAGRDARRVATRPSRAAARRSSLAALRLAFCGGFDLDDPEILAEAAAAAGAGARRLPARGRRRAGATARSSGRAPPAAVRRRRPAAGAARRAAAVLGRAPVADARRRPRGSTRAAARR